MAWTSLAENLSNPALLFFFLGIAAHYIKSDLEIPPGSSRFISLYLLFSIGFKGGVELSHQHLDASLLGSVMYGLVLTIVIPVIVFFLLKKRFGVFNAGALAASYGSVSVVTAVTAYAFLEEKGITVPGHFTVILAIMESPAIIAGLALISLYARSSGTTFSVRNTLVHALTNGSVVLILGSLVIGMLSSEGQAEGIKPFTNDLFKGFLAIFLLDMGLTSGKKLKAFFSHGAAPVVIAMVLPVVNGCVSVLVSGMFTDDSACRFMFAVLAASASYIAVPAAMKINVPQADEGLYIPMALAITFPVNISVGLPLYYFMACNL